MTIFSRSARPILGQYMVSIDNQWRVSVPKGLANALSHRRLYCCKSGNPGFYIIETDVFHRDVEAGLIKKVAHLLNEVYLSYDYRFTISKQYRKDFEVGRKRCAILGRGNFCEFIPSEMLYKIEDNSPMLTEIMETLGATRSASSLLKAESDPNAGAPDI